MHACRADRTPSEPLYSSNRLGLLYLKTTWAVTNFHDSLPPSLDVRYSLLRDNRSNVISAQAHHGHYRDPGFRKLLTCPLFPVSAKTIEETTQALKWTTQMCFEQNVDQFTKELLQFTNVLWKVSADASGDKKLSIVPSSRRHLPSWPLNTLSKS